MKLEGLKLLISAVALSSSILTAAFAETAAAQRSSGGSFGSSSSGGPQTRFTIFTETLDGIPIVDSNPSPSSGLFQGAVSYSFVNNALSFNGFGENRSIQIESLDLVTVDRGRSVEFTLFSPNPYQEYVTREVFNESGIRVGTETVQQTLAPGIISTFLVSGYRPIPIDPIRGLQQGDPLYNQVDIDDQTRSKLVNSLGFIVNNVRDLDFRVGDSLINDAVINLGIDVTKITDDSSGRTVGVPEPATTTAAFIAGAIGLVTTRKRKLQQR